jgi:hypothetical protein
MGLAIPSDMDGRVLGEALAVGYTGLDGVRVSTSGETASPTSSAVSPDDELSEEDTEIIINRLRGLGYVG